tara:strand:+ start:6562 stop:8721 length:2160 start_codon:yes stop_codon:yes gene_type:complete
MAKAQNTIEIKFQAKDAPKLKKAIESLDKATKSLISSQAHLSKAGKKVIDHQSRQTDALRKMQVRLKALGGSLRRSGVSTELLIKAQQGHAVALQMVRNQVARYERQLKGLGETTKKTSQRTRILGGSFAVIRSKMLLFNFAMALGVRQLINFSQQASRLDSMKASFASLAGGTMDSQKALEDLRIATNNTMSEFDLLQQANNALVLGVAKNSDEMAEMFDIAQRLGRALGRDTASSVESLITGIGRQSRLMLDNIGIIVKTKDAYAVYAEELNKSVDSLTEVEQKQAFLNATLDSAKRAVALAGDEFENSQSMFEKLSATSENTSAIIGEALTPAFIDLSKVLIFGLNKLSDFTRGIFGLSIALERRKTLARELVSIMKQDIVSLQDRDKVINATISNIKKQSKEAFEEEQKSIKSLISSLDILKKSRTEQAIMREQDTLREKLFKEETKGMSESFIKNNKNIIDAIVQARLVQELKTKLEKDSHSKEMQRIRERLDALITLKDLESELLEIRNKKEFESRQRDFEQEIALREHKIKLLKKTKEEEEKNANATLAHVDRLSSALAQATLNGQNMGEAVVNSIKAIAVEMASKAFIFTAFQALGIGGVGTAGKTLAQFLGFAHTGGLIKEDGDIQRFATGGMVEGQDNVPIMAQAGEFVIRKAVVEQVGVDNLARLNSGEGNVGSTVNVNINGNMIGNEEFVRDTLIPEINKTVKQGLA